MTKNQKLLGSFTAYCKSHPDMRFWQAVTNWSGASQIKGTWLVEGKDLRVTCDTYYIEGLKPDAVESFGKAD